MFKIILNKKTYLSIVILFFLIGCGGGESANSSNVINFNVNGKSNGYSQREELNAYREIPELNREYQRIEAESNLTTTGSKEAISDIHTKLLNAINEKRAQRITCGDHGTFGPVHPLTWNNNLHASAIEHIMDLAFSRTFSHDGSGTQYDITGHGRPSKFYERIVANGYNNYYSVGENIAGGQRTITEVMNAWMASPGHCENIMKSTYTEVGVSVIKIDGSPYTYYWGQNFGSKRR